MVVENYRFYNQPIIHIQNWFRSSNHCAVVHRVPVNTIREYRLRKRGGMFKSCVKRIYPWFTFSFLASLAGSWHPLKSPAKGTCRPVGMRRACNIKYRWLSSILISPGGGVYSEKVERWLLQSCLGAAGFHPFLWVMGISNSIQPDPFIDATRFLTRMR